MSRITDLYQKNAPQDLGNVPVFVDEKIASGCGLHNYYEWLCEKFDENVKSGKDYNLKNFE